MPPLRSLAALAAVSFACAGPPAASSAPAQPPPEPLGPGPGPEGDTVSTRTRTTTTLAPGVHVIRHEDAPDTFPQGNTTIIVGAREVLVVDACYLPSSAARDIAEIRTLTDKPVRWLVNTHWHYDHTMGNGAYRDAFPGLKIVAHTETRDQIAGYNPQWFARFPDRAKTFEKVLAEGKDASGRTLSELELAEYRTALAGLAPVWAELEPLAARTDLAPDTIFERELVIDLGGREVRLLHLGRGNTAGDALVWLPAEKILVTGDLLVHPVPYLSGGYPTEHIATLRAARALGAATYIPGHGHVLRGHAYLDRVVAFLQAVVDAVDAEIHRTGSGFRKLDAVKAGLAERFPLAEWRARFAGDDPEARDFFEGFAYDGVVTAAFSQMWGR